MKKVLSNILLIVFFLATSQWMFLLWEVFFSHTQNQPNNHLIYHSVTIKPSPSRWYSTIHDTPINPLYCIDRDRTNDEYFAIDYDFVSQVNTEKRTSWQNIDLSKFFKKDYSKYNNTAPPSNTLIQVTHSWPYKDFVGKITILLI